MRNKIAFRKPIKQLSAISKYIYKKILGGSSSPHKGSSSPHRGSMFRTCHVRTDTISHMLIFIFVMHKMETHLYVVICVLHIFVHAIPLWARLDNSTPHRLERLEVHLIKLYVSQRGKQFAA